MPQYILPHPKARDSFGRLRVAEPYTLFDSKMLHGKLELFWDEDVTNTSNNASSDWIDGEALIEMYVEQDDAIIRQTRMRFNYQPGKSQHVIQTGLLASGSGVVSRIGAFDENNGLFFQLSSGVASVVIRNNGDDNVIPQSSWNVDRLNGSGPCGVTIDWTKAQIFSIDFEWLSLGVVRFGLYLGGDLCFVHIEDHLNVLTGPYMATPNLPLRYEISSVDASATMKHICSTVILEGAEEETGITRAVSTGATPIAASTANAIYTVLGIRLRETTLDSRVIVENINIFNESSQDFEWMLLFNPTVTQPPQFTAIPDSAGWEVAHPTATNTVTEGQWELLMAGGYVKNGSQGGQSFTGAPPNSVRLGALIDGTRDEIWLCVRPLSSNAVINGTLTVRETS